MNIEPFMVENARVTLKACALMLEFMAEFCNNSELQQVGKDMADDARATANELPKADFSEGPK